MRTFGISKSKKQIPKPSVFDRRLTPRLAGVRLKIYGFQGEPFKSASVKTASNEIQKTQFGQRQHTRNQNSQFQNSQNSKCLP
jgi:hypothetical protein